MNQKWFSRTCEQLRRELRTITKAVDRNPTNPFLRGRFFSMKKRYKNCCKNSKRKYEQEIIARLEEMQSKKPDEFWKLLQTLREDNRNKKLVSPSTKEFLDHYKLLLQDKHTPNSTANKNDDIPIELEGLNQEISIKEIEGGLTSLKNGKSPGLDNLYPEMIKCVKDNLLLDIQKLFNKILGSRYYLEIWNHGLIYSIYKNGGPKDPGNYRGITITSCLGKLFGSILYKRIEEALERHDLLSR